MRRIIFTRALPTLALALLSACGSGESDSPGGDAGGAARVAGTHPHTLLVDGENREFIVYVSSLAAAAAKAPVVIMFHGTSGDGPKFYNISHWVEKADEEGLIAVFPSSLFYCFFEDENMDGDFGDPGEDKHTTKWDSGKLGTEFPLCTQQQIDALPPAQSVRADHGLLDDVRFMQAMLDFLRANYPIDEKRIYGTGFSNGGQFTSRLIADMSDRFAALAVAAGSMHLPQAQGPTTRPLSVVYTVGETDNRFTPLFGGMPLPLDETFVAAPIVQARILLPYLTSLDLADVYAYDEAVVAGRKVVRFTYSTSNGAATNELQLLVIEGLGHVYPNGTNHPLTMANYLWDFFRTRSLP